MYVSRVLRNLSSAISNTLLYFLLPRAVTLYSIIVMNIVCEVRLFGLKSRLCHFLLLELGQVILSLCALISLSVKRRLPVSLESSDEFMILYSKCLE